MRFSCTSIMVVTIVVAAVAFAGCSGGSPAGGSQTTPATGTPAASLTAPAGTPGSAVSGSSLFGGLNYNWVEYRMTTGTGSDAMTVYYKYNKVTGKCSMRFEGAAAAQMPANMREMDCTSTGSTATTSDPNDVNPDAKIDCSPIPETVTVPAGTFSATRCTVTTKEGSSTAWVVKDKFLVRTDVKTPEGAMEMVLNSYG